MIASWWSTQAGYPRQKAPCCWGKQCSVRRKREKESWGLLSALEKKQLLSQEWHPAEYYRLPNTIVWQKSTELLT
jgi:hypothetical protein